MHEYRADNENKYSAPTEFLREELVRCLYRGSLISAKYRSTSQINHMRNFMETIAPAYWYFLVYADENDIKLSEEQKRIIRKANAYYDYSNSIRLSPSEINKILRILIKLAYRSGLYNVHSLKHPDVEGV